MEKQRLSKVLAGFGVASRRACEKLIFSKRVKVNGKTAIEPQMGVNADTDIILVDNQPVNKNIDSIYLIFHKPRGLVCSHNKAVHKKIIYDFFGEESSRLFSVGRLDKDTSGLLIMTNDGAFAQEVIHPSSDIAKEYIVKTNKEILDSHLKIIQKGCQVEGKWVSPAKVLKVRRGTLKVIVKEGRKREVRHLVENADLQIVELKRVAIGNLKLGTLKEGTYRPLTEHEKEQIFAK